MPRGTLVQLWEYQTQMLKLLTPIFEVCLERRLPYSGLITSLHATRFSRNIGVVCPVLHETMSLHSRPLTAPRFTRTLVMRRRPRGARRLSVRRADRPHCGQCASPPVPLRRGARAYAGANRRAPAGVITAPGKVSVSRRFYVIIRGTAWSGEAVATVTADGRVGV